jgi:hypothetical protein
MLSGSAVSARDGAEGVFDPVRAANLVFSSERLHEGLASEALVEAMLKANTTDDVASLPLADSDRVLLADILMHDAEELTPELLENAILALRQKKQLRLREQELKVRLAEAERRQDPAELTRLQREKLELDRTLAAGR